MQIRELCCAVANLRLKIDKELLRRVKVVAARRGVSLSRLVAEYLEDFVRHDSDYESAKQDALRLLNQGLPLGGTPCPAKRAMRGADAADRP